MTSRSTIFTGILGAAMLFATTGCTSYYKVTDPTTGRSYYATGVENLSSGATRLTDERTKTEVTIQNSQVEKITKDQYEAALYASPATRPM
jgi:hypothetical protein